MGALLSVVSEARKGDRENPSRSISFAPHRPPLGGQRRWLRQGLRSAAKDRRPGPCGAAKPPRMASLKRRERDREWGSGPARERSVYERDVATRRPNRVGGERPRIKKKLQRAIVR